MRPVTAPRFLAVLIGLVLAISPAMASGGRGTARETNAVPKDGGISFSGILFDFNVKAGRDLDGRDVDRAWVDKELDRLALHARAYLVGAQGPRPTVAALNRVIFKEEGFVYDPTPGDTENYLLDRVLARRRGNCLGITSVYLALAEKLGIPLGGVYVPSHCFVRYEGNGARINIETAENGAERSDDWYARKFQIGKGRPYLHTLGKREMIGVYLKSLGVAYSRKGREEEALRLYRDAAAFYPGLPDAYYNSGVSYQKLGKHEEAMGQYRRAIALDPGLDSARGNLASTLCGCGRLEDGIEEFLRALEVNPKNATARAGLAKAYFARGEYGEAIGHCDRAMEQGCRFEPSMLEVLDRHRRPGDARALP